MYRITFLDEEYSCSCIIHFVWRDQRHTYASSIRTSDMIKDALDMAKLRRGLSLDAQLYFGV